jgi:hypothetical protein
MYQDMFPHVPDRTDVITVTFQQSRRDGFRIFPAVDSRYPFSFLDRKIPTI